MKNRYLSLMAGLFILAASPSWAQLRAEDDENPISWTVLTKVPVEADTVEIYSYTPEKVGVVGRKFYLMLSFEYKAHDYCITNYRGLTNVEPDDYVAMAGMQVGDVCGQINTTIAVRQAIFINFTHDAPNNVVWKVIKLNGQAYKIFRDAEGKVDIVRLIP